MRRLRVLVIDDQPSAGAQIEEQAEVLGQHCELDVRQVGSENDILQIVWSWKPSVVLLNAHVMVGNSLAILDELRDGCAPVVITSLYNSKTIQESVRQRGAAAYVSGQGNPEYWEQLMASLESVSAGAFIEQ